MGAEDSWVATDGYFYVLRGKAISREPHDGEDGHGTARSGGALRRARADGGAGARRGGDRRRRGGGRGGPPRRDPGAVRGARRGARLRLRHLVAVLEADPRRPALPGAAQL